MRREGCVFCGGTPLTVEHVIPNWLGQELPTLGDGPAAGFATGRKDLLRPGDEMQFFIKKKVRGELRTPFEVRRVCDRCNSGWLSDLENQVKTFLTPMVHGDPVRLPDYAMRSVGAWAVKTATMFRYSDSPPVSTPEWRNRSLFRHKTPPPGSSVFLARYEGDGVGGLWMRSELVERTGSVVASNPVHLSSIRLGDLVLLIVEVFSGSAVPLTIPDEWRPAVIQLWPYDRPLIVWPPQRSITDAGVRQLVRIFDPPAPTKRGPRKARNETDSAHGTTEDE